MSCGISRRPSPDCGYSTCPSSSSDDDLPSETLRAGFCPHCHRPFDQPQTLQCGHSLCAPCVTSLLSKQSNSSLPQRNRVRMGLRSCALQFKTTEDVMYRSPGCVVCGEPPKLCPPVPNLELQLLLQTLPRFDDIPSFKSKMCDPLDEEDESSFMIRENHVALIGSHGVGKTSLRSRQFGNEIVFDDILGRRNNNGAIQDSFMLDIVDGDNSDADFDSSDGFLLVYSIADRDSFRALPEIYDEIVSRRGPRVPIVLVGNKADQRNKRKVESFEGQALARDMQCPFLEVSSKLNDGVNEAFTELARIMEVQRLKKK